MNAALAAAVEALEAERLAPVPRAVHIIAVDRDDLAALISYLTGQPGPGAVPESISGPLARLTAAARLAAAHGAARLRQRRAGIP